ncbi:alpha/beta fold hydrolase [Dendrosporobacter sp. 1207_IL3150]|uniref:alpha/beta fold hydrolase n=1 Tax=Dendrosporobacter sp. 1207_IL3150 TaxID=3084054 RepID=UPI002FD9B663
MNIYKPICAPPLPNVLGGQQGIFRSSYGDIVYNLSGNGEPLLLIHGINTGASFFEWRNNISALDRCYSVYAVDLPGFGMSEKREIVYTAEVYKTVIREFLMAVVRKPVHILSSSLSSAYCIGIASEFPELVKSLILVTPSGIGINNEEPNNSNYAMFKLFANPVQGDALYNAFASRTSIKYFLTEYIYANPANVTEGTVEYLYNAANQCPNAKYAPASFITGMSNYNIEQQFSEIYQPILLIWGRKAKIGSIQYIDKFIEINPRAKYYVFENSAVNPQAEEYAKFNRLIMTFLDDVSK